MKRDMDLCRKIIFAIEEKHIDTPVYDLRTSVHKSKN